MPETLPSALVTEKNLLATPESWAWLIELQVDTTRAIRITTHDSSLSFSSETWVPFPIELAEIRRDSEGRLPSLELRISNLSREVADEIESGNLTDQSAKIQLVSTTESPIVTAAHVVTFTILAVTIELRDATLSLGKPNLFEMPFPSQRFVRAKCRWVYGGPGCGFDLGNNYPTTPPNYPNFDETTCDLGLDTANGCKAHGEAEEVNGFEKKHPLRIGSFPNIPKGPARLG